MQDITNYKMKIWVRVSLGKKDFCHVINLVCPLTPDNNCESKGIEANEYNKPELF